MLAYIYHVPSDSSCFMTYTYSPLRNVSLVTPPLGRQMQVWLVILARKAATSCLAHWAERSNQRAMGNIPVVVARQLYGDLGMDFPGDQ